MNMPETIILTEKSLELGSGKELEPVAEAQLLILNTLIRIIRNPGSTIDLTKAFPDNPRVRSYLYSNRIGQILKALGIDVIPGTVRDEVLASNGKIICPPDLSARRWNDEG